LLRGSIGGSAPGETAVPLGVERTRHEGEHGRRCGTDDARRDQDRVGTERLRQRTDD
jgi:hypothetical protein